jgi:hypothetical protein
MDLAGMVAFGEYSDGCICKVKDKSLMSLTYNDFDIVGDFASACTAAPVIGVIQEMERMQAAAAAQPAQPVSY